MDERTTGRLRRALTTKWAIPPWIIFVWSVASFVGNVQFLIGAYTWTLPRIQGLSGRAQGALLMIVGFVWLAILITLPEKRLAATKLREVSNWRLRHYAIALTRQLRAFEATEYQRERLANEQEWQQMNAAQAATQSEEQRQAIWVEYTSASINRSQAHDTEYRTRFHGDVMALYEELKRRVGDVENEPYGVPIVLKSGMLSGGYPIQMATDYLDRMARRLP